MTNIPQPVPPKPARPRAAAADRPAVTHHAAARPAVTNRVATVMLHTSRYGFRGRSRLAKDARVARSTVSRLLAGRVRPSFALACAVTRALEAALHTRIDPREVFSLDGTYPTRSGCALCGCRGCLPEEAYDAEGNLRPEYRGQKPGDWSMAPERESYLENVPDVFRQPLQAGLGPPAAAQREGQS